MNISSSFIVCLYVIRYFNDIKCWSKIFSEIFSDIGGHQIQDLNEFLQIFFKNHTNITQGVRMQLKDGELID